MNKIKDKELRKNGSGYQDPTAYVAIKKSDNISMKKNRNREKDISDAMHIIKRILEIMGFEIDGRIVLIDKYTGIKYK